MRIVLAPDSFKECLPAAAVCAALAEGVRRAAPHSQIEAVPMADGGQGTVDALVHATGGELRTVRVTGPLGEPVDARYGILGDRTTAVIEMAAASGLERLPPDRRNPWLTTTYGTGELIRQALDAGVRRLLIGIGGSATNDGGAGMAEALGLRLLDASGQAIPRGGGGLERLDRIDASGRDSRLAHTAIDVACDVTNPLTGPQGASAVYGPQKGATPDMVARLDANLERLAALIERDLGIDVRTLTGAGAAGGLGAGLVAFAGGELRRGIELVMDAVGLRQRLQNADLCITGEGALDRSSQFGKTAVGVARLAAEVGVPVVAVAGAIRAGARAVLECGVTAYFSISPGPGPLDDALAEASARLADTAEQIVRLFAAGRSR